MKWQNVVLIMFVLVLGVTTLVFFKDEIFAEKVELSESEKKGMRLLKTAQEICLSGESKQVDLYTKVQGSLEKGVDAGAGISDINSKGAVNYLDESIRQIADEKIRTCLEKEMPAVRACILGNCDAAILPKTIDFKFASPKLDKLNQENLYSDTAFFRYQYVPEKKIVKQSDGYFSKTIGLLSIGETRTVQLTFQVRNGNSLTFQPEMFCLQRAKSINIKLDKYVIFDCKETGECVHDDMSPKWFELVVPCPVNEDEHVNATNWLSYLIPAAHAQTTEAFWSVPSIETLESRVASEDLTGIGYTHFNIRSAQSLNIDADAFYYDLRINGQTVLENGLYSDFNAKIYDPNAPLNIDFGLQNLNFSGRLSGCDEMSIDIHFLKNAKPVGESISWQRSYVSLRDAREKQLTIGDNILSWTGGYKRASKEFDSEVFVNSIFVHKDLNFADNLTAIKKTQEDMVNMKGDFDRANLTFDGKPLVAVIRPPLTQTSYGLAVGVVEESGQIRYTFAYSIAKELKDYLLSLREQGQQFKRIIRHDSNIYTLRPDKGYSQSPPVCWDELPI